MVKELPRVSGLDEIRKKREAAEKLVETKEPLIAKGTLLKDINPERVAKVWEEYCDALATRNSFIHSFTIGKSPQKIEGKDGFWVILSNEIAKEKLEADRGNLQSTMHKVLDGNSFELYYDFDKQVENLEATLTEYSAPKSKRDIVEEWIKENPYLLDLINELDLE